MGTLFVVQGVSNCGKSSTVRLLQSLLTQRFPEGTWEKHKSRRFGGDICGIFIVNGVKIGIEGQGDVVEPLMEMLKEFIKLGCEILVCTDRSRRVGATPIDVMKALGYNAVVKRKVRIVGEREQEIADQKIANEIVDEITAILTKRKAA